MNRKNLMGLAVVSTALSGLAVAACGKIGPLDQPAPLFGAKARAAYYAERAQPASPDAAPQRNDTGSAERTVSNEDDATTNVTGGGAAARGDPNAEDAPLTTRDIQDPDQQMSSPRNSPVPGAPNSAGPTPSLTPPN